jgi:hypothetical protein
MICSKITKKYESYNVLYDLLLRLVFLLEIFGNLTLFLFSTILQKEGFGDDIGYVDIPLSFFLWKGNGDSFLKLEILQWLKTIYSI